MVQEFVQELGKASILVMVLGSWSNSAAEMMMKLKGVRGKIWGTGAELAPKLGMLVALAVSIWGKELMLVVPALQV